MLSYDDALSRILDSVTPLEIVNAPLLRAAGAALARDIAANTSLPPFDNSQMDGYAVQAASTVSASKASPVCLTVIGEIPAGTRPNIAVTPGTAARIFTGAAMPEGADAVVMVEDTASSGDGGIVDVFEPATARQFVRFAGEDSKLGDIVATAGTTITPGVIALAAATGHAGLPVRRRPRVAIVSTGDELVTPGEPLRHGQIYESNSYGLAAQIAEAGADCVAILRASDNADSLRAALAEVDQHNVDAIVSSGGVSVGDYDLVKDVFGEQGSIDFWRVAIRPGKPFAFGQRGSALFFGLPGNPASAMVTFELFVRPALRALSGHAQPSRPLVRATLSSAVTHDPGRRSFVRAVVTASPAGLTVAAPPDQGSHRLRSLAIANCLLLVPETVERIEAGEAASIIVTGGIA